MSGKMDAAYFRAYRAANRERLNAQMRARRATGRVRGDRSAEYAKRQAARPKAEPRPMRFVDPPYEPLPVLYPDLQQGRGLAFWHDELRMDLAQEAELARLEGRDPAVAVATYSRRENTWWHREVKPRYVAWDADEREEAA